MSPKLAGRTVVVTRARAQAGGLAERLRELGATVLECPLIRIERAPETDELDAAIERLGEYDWIAFTSANGVDFFLQRLREREAMECLPPVAAVGKGTAAALARAGARCDLIAPEAIADSLAAALVERGIAGKRVLFPKARIARETLPQALEAAGAHVDAVVVYETRPDHEGARPLLEALGTVDAVMFASASAVDAFHAVAGEHVKAKAVSIVSIGPVTTARAEELGYRVAATAEEHTIDGLIAALCRMWLARN